MNNNNMKFFKNIEAKVMSYSVLLLLMFVVISSVFILLPSEDRTVRANPATYIYTEDFEDDTIGSVDNNNHTNPSEDWYWAYESYDNGVGDGNITNALNGTGGKTFSVKANSSAYYKEMFKLYNGTSFQNNSVEYIEWYMYSPNVNDRPSFGFYKYWSGGWGNPSGSSYSIGSIIISATSDIYWYNGANQDTGVNIVASTWIKIRVDFNWTDDEVEVTIDDVSTGWYAFRVSADSMYSFEISYVTTGGTSQSGYFNNITLGTDYILTSLPQSASTFSLSGVNNYDRIVFSGQAGDTVWSNETSYGTLEINYNVNSSDNVTEIKVNLTDVDVGEGILAGNISLTFDDDNSSWTTNTVTYSGLNITINESVWDAQSWCSGSNPFPIDGVGWTNGTIYVHFKIEIDSGATTDSYWTDSCKVWFYLV